MADTPGTQAARFIAAGGAVAVLAGAAVMVARLPVSVILITYWMAGAAVISACLIAFVKGRRFTRLPVAQGKVLAIVPTYKEEPENVYGCIRSLLAQTEHVHQIVVVDDGSPDPVAPFIHPRVMWIRQENKGKRGAHCTALRQFSPGEFRFILTVDSDSRPHPDALEHLLRAMSSRKVQAATGWIYIRNYADSWVARAADIDIGGSCVMMRASRSMLGALETTSGALALYRSEILYDHLDEYEVECGTGDDRWLAMRALLRGEVVGVAEAMVDTDMPVTLDATRRQRFRWARSWWCMIPFAFARLSPRQLISPAYGLVQLAIAPVIVAWTAFAWTMGLHERLGHPGVALVFLGSYAVVRYALSALYLAGRPGMPRREKWISLLIGTPLAVLLNLFLLMPVRYQALLQVGDSRWGNR